MKKNLGFDSDYRLTDDPNFLLDMFGVPPFVRDLLDEVQIRAEKGSEKTIQKLLKYVVRFPGVPQLKNLLTVAYFNAGKPDKAYEANRWLVKEHPGYIFGRINMVNECVAMGNIEKVPELLEEKMDLQELYPEREVFHIQEFTSFQLCVINYLCELGDLEAARTRHHFMFDRAPEHPDTQYALELIEEMEAFDEWDPAILNEDGRPFMPGFTHKEVELLYSEDLSIPESMLNGILKLPGKTLISDLELVLEDAKERFHYFYSLYLEDDIDDHQTMFPLHAIFLLGETGSAESLPLILEFLGQDQDVLDFWFGDILTEGVWQPLYDISENELVRLSDFILDPEVYIFSRTLSSTVISRTAVFKPDRRDEAIKWYEEVLDIFIEQKKQGPGPDEGLVTMIALDMITCSLHELLPCLSRLFELQMIDQDELELFEEAEEEILGPVDPFVKSPSKDIHSRYRELIELF